jgi:hypothetical protein
MRAARQRSARSGRDQREAGYNTGVRRLVLGLVAGLLALSASGGLSLLVDEPCTGYELRGQGEDDNACPPTCVTCGCCAQAVEAIALTTARAPDAPIAGLAAVLPGPLNADPRDILHVPKSVLA